MVIPYIPYRSQLNFLVLRPKASTLGIVVVASVLNTTKAPNLNSATIENTQCLVHETSWEVHEGRSI